MHIPDGFLTPPVWGAMDVAGGVAVLYGMRQVGRRLEEKDIPLMGVLAAFVFAAQMINLPVAGGTSGHFLGGALVGIVLGPWCGLMVMTVVLLVQCFLFQDGGIAALGANVSTMGVIGSSGAYALARGLARVLKGPRRLFWQGFFAAWIGATLAALLCAGLLVASGTLSAGVAFSLIGGVTALLGLLEGLVTGTVLESLARARPDLLERPKV